MEHGEGLDMAQVAKGRLLRLFDNDRTLWSVCYPSNIQSNPSSQKSYCVVGLQPEIDSSDPVSVCCNGVLDEIRQEIETAFSPERSALFNTSFWGALAQDLRLLLSSGLAWVDTKSMSTEAEIRTHLLRPLLQRIAHCASNMTVQLAENPSNIEYASSLALELPSEVRMGKRGRKPEVDFVISGFVQDDPLYIIPIEAKKHCEVSHMSQLAHYVSTLSLHSHASVGLLMDTKQVMLAFSYLCSPVGRQAPITLPIVLVSPGMAWRTESALHMPTVVALCLIPFFRIRRKNISINLIEWETAFGEAWPQVISTAQRNADENPIENRHTAQKLLSAMKGDVDLMKEKLVGSETMVKKLTFEVKWLKEQLNEVLSGVESPERKRKRASEGTEVDPEAEMDAETETNY